MSDNASKATPKDCNTAIELFLEGKLKSPSMWYSFKQYAWYTRIFAVLTAPFWLGIYLFSKATSWKNDPTRTTQEQRDTRNLLYYLSTLRKGTNQSVINLSQYNRTRAYIFHLILQEFTRELRDDELRIGRYITNQEKKRIAKKLVGAIQPLRETAKHKTAEEACIYALKKYKGNRVYASFLAGKTLAFICASAAAIATFGYAIYIMPGLAIGYSIALICAMISAYITFKMYHYEMPDVITEFTVFGVNEYLRKNEDKSTFTRKRYTYKQHLIRVLSAIPILISATFAAVMTYQGLLHSLMILGPLLGPTAILLAGVTFIGTVVLSFNSYTEAIEQGFGFWQEEKNAFLKTNEGKSDALKKQKEIIFFTTLVFFALVVILGNILSDVLSALRLEHKVTWLPKYLASIGMTSINTIAMLAFVIKSAAKAASVLSSQITWWLEKTPIISEGNNPIRLYIIIPIASCVTALLVLCFAIVKALAYPLQRAWQAFQNRNKACTNEEKSTITSAWDRCATAVHNLIKGISRAGQIMEAEITARASSAHSGPSTAAFGGALWTILKSNISFARVIYKVKDNSNSSTSTQWSDHGRKNFRCNAIENRETQVTSDQRDKPHLQLQAS